MLGLITQKFKYQSLNEVTPTDAKSLQDIVSATFTEDSTSYFKNDEEEFKSNEDGESTMDDTALPSLMTSYCENKENIEITTDKHTNNKFDFLINNRSVANDIKFNITCCQQQQYQQESYEQQYQKKEIVQPKYKKQSIVQVSNISVKRKLSTSYLKLPPLVHSYSDSSSSDDEIKDLCSKYKYISHRSPAKKTDSHVTTCNLLKHRKKIFCIEGEISRPSLNLEKMQQKLLRKQRPRIVKIRAIKQFPTCIEALPEMVSFKPINLVANNGCKSSIEESSLQSVF